MANPTTNLGMTKPTVGGSTDTWGATINTNVVDIIDALFSISGTDVTMSDIKFNSIGLQETGAGTDTVKIQAPAAVTQYTLTMPGAVGSDGQVLSAAGAAGVLAWTTPEVGDITSVADATNGGMTVTNGGGPAVTLAVNLNDLSAAAVNVANDSIAILDADDSSTKKESIADLIAAIDGTGLTASSGVLAVDAAQTQITSVGTIGTGTWQGTAVANAYVSDALTISGGSVDNSPVGAGTAAAGTFTQVDVQAQGDLRLQDTTGGQYVAFQAAGATTSYTLTMPAAVPSANDVLTASDGSGTLSWAAPTTGDITAITAGTGLSGTNLTGPVPTLNVDAAQTQITSVGALGAGSISSGFGNIDVGSSSIDGGTITAATALVGTLSTAAQANITSVGTLTSLAVGNITSTGNLALTAGLAAIGAATNAAVALNITSNDMAGVNQYGINLNPTFTSDATTTGWGLRINTGTDNASFTQANMYGINVLNATQGSGSTITNLYGLKIESQTAGGTNYAIHTGTGAVSFGDHVSLAATKKLYLDGGSNTFLYESAADTMSFATNGTDRWKIDDAGNFRSVADGSYDFGGDTAGRARGIYAESFLSIVDNAASAGQLRLAKNFGVKSRNQANSGDLLVMTENHVTGTGSLEFGDNSAGTWTDMRFHVSTGNVIVLTSTLIALNKATTMNNASILMTALAVSDPGVAGQLWRSGNDLKISTG